MNVLSAAANLFFPPQCFSCNKRVGDSVILCDECASQLVSMEELQCAFCQKETSSSFICEECKNKYPFDEVVCAYMFTPPVQKMIHHFKYNEYKKIGTYLGNKLAVKLAAYPFISNTDWIIPVPLHKTKKRFRGFNQSEIIARSISRTLNIPVLKGILKRTKFTQTQTRLDQKEREKNVAGAFYIKNSDKIKKKSVLLVDDVLTTGSTMKSIALLLKEKLAAHIYVCTLARA